MRSHGIFWLAVLLAFSFSGCKQQGEETPAGPTVVERPAQPAASVPGAASVTAAEVPAEPAPAVGRGPRKGPKYGKGHPLHKPRRPILVGGCRDACESPDRGVRHFVRALASGDEERTRLFLETSLLVDDGRDLGSDWVRMWKAGELDARGQSVRAATKSLVERLKPAMAGLPAAADALGQRLRFGKNDGRQVPVWFRPKDDGPVWFFRLSRRGIEWLVSEVDTQGRHPEP